ncbi:SAM-dependent methyltransferase [Varunaivibrio sulfuroxidans]|uniref:Cyclopropane-fatty-acyl-phospholipid synthase n=1 Tax=Varunaivibrio sulfuroxidans TaxID=1773489 RepID=A0A4R3J5L6_9PROT|nr:cyclopropane-fatty-acyl-phospholipid synthase family protein [Varunaivibrio sulfuroxidans]TCS60133.1 cyclopropane-fatty-acyl-phospholipid synthase [Varunaivibrio sulfuroxidans]WES30895.1 cyclopropane-fatty-acyl-phospholipid synthase [Varunaivibrio sulfuroxidans]
MKLLSLLLRQLIQVGTLRVIDWRGKIHVFEGAYVGPHRTIRLHDRRVAYALFLNPELALGEAYTDGRLTIEGGQGIYDFLDFIGANMALRDGFVPFTRIAGAVRFALRRLHQLNPPGRARRNVAHHYDLSATLYDLFLDADRQYSCAYFETGAETLDEAQEKKKRHIEAKLLLKETHRVLDVGSGWGGLALDIARQSGARVDGVTLSTEQLGYARTRAEKAGLDARVHFDLRDYRTVEGKYDRIVSVGMFEHVGVDHYVRFFQKMGDLLKDDGVFLLHTIGRMDGPSGTNPWIRKYIFPGGYNPSLSEVARAVERANLNILDIEILRLHYAETLKAWRARFTANRARAEELYDARFFRMWEFYLALSEMAFRRLRHVVFQIQIGKEITATPLTRTYITEREHRNDANGRLPHRVA